MERMKKKVANLLTISNNSHKNISNHGASNSNSDSRWPKFISFLLLIMEVILNDLGDGRKYCH